MTDVSSYSVELVGNESEFIASMQAAVASARESAAAISEAFDGTAADMGASTAAMGAEAKAGMVDLESDMGAAGAAAGAAVSDGVKDGASGLEEDLGDAGLLAGGAARDGVKDGVDGVEDDLSDAGEDAGKGLSDGVEKGSSGIKGMLGNLGVPESLLGGWGALAVGVGAVGGVAIDLGEKMQSADAAIATAASESVAAATAIGNSFLQMKGEFSGEEIASAFASVAGQLASVEGHALSTAEADQVMNAATDLATAKQISLSEATQAVASTMQAFQVSTKNASDVSDILFNASNATGQSVTTLGAALDKVRTKLGGMSPPLSQLSGLLVDMTDHGETGRAAMTSLTTAFTDFLKPAADAATAQSSLKVALDALPPSLKSLGESIANGTITGTALTTATDGLSTSQAALIGKVTSATGAVATANEAQAKMGISALTSTGQMKPLSDIIGQLHNQIAGMTTAQAIAQLQSDGFTSASAKLVTTIQAGPAAYDKATASATKMGSAHAGAAKQSDTLAVEMKTLKAQAEDWETELGGVLIPVLTELMGAVGHVIDILGNVIGWFEKGSAPARDLAIVIGTVVAGAFSKMAIEASKDLATMVADTASSMAQGALSMLGFGEAAEATEATTEEAAVGIDAATAGMGGVFGLLIIAVMEIAEHWKQIWAGIKEVVEVVWDGIKSVTVTVWDFIKAHLQEVIEVIVAIVAGPLGVLADEIYNHWTTIKSDAETVWNDIVGFFTGIPGKIMNALESLVSDIEGLAKTVWDDFLHANESAETEVLTFFSKIGADVLKAVGDAGSWLLGVGKDIMDGLLKGITNGEQDVLNGIKKVGSDVSSAFKSVLSIFSPSKVFESHGQMIMQGLANGIAENGGLAVGATNAIAKQIGSVPFTAPVPSGAVAAAAGGSSGPLGATAPLLGGGASHTEVNINNPATTQTPQEIAHQVSLALKTYGV